jgi:radical SAM protein with 4Fe4S-binding SPASM domain
MMGAKMQTNGQKEDFEFPDVIRLETSGRCNFRCIHCANGQNPPKRGLLSPEVEEALDLQFHHADFIPRVMVLYHGGEPLMHPRLPEIIRKYKYMGVSKIKLNTNASLLNADKARALIESGLDELYVSFDGESPEENDAIRKNGNFLAASANVKKLLRIKEECGARNPVVTVCNVRVATREMIEKYISDDAQGLPTIPQYLQDAFGNVGAGAIQFISNPAIAWPGMSKSAAFQIHSAERDRIRFCSTPIETITVMANGDVVPCCIDIVGEQVLGNILSQTIFDIWKSPKSRAFRTAMVKGAPIGICRRCSELYPRYLIRPDDAVKSFSDDEK